MFVCLKVSSKFLYSIILSAELLINFHISNLYGIWYKPETS